MCVERRYIIWLFHLFALAAAGVGLAMLVIGYGLITPNQEIPDRMRARVVSLDWEQSVSEHLPAAWISVAGLDRPFEIKDIRPARVKDYEDLVGRQVDLWLVPDISNPGSKIIFRLEGITTDIRYKDDLAIASAYDGDEKIRTSRIKWGALLVVAGALFFVVARLVGIWYRYRDEILGSSPNG